MLSCSEVVCTFHSDPDDEMPSGTNCELEVAVTHAGAGPYLVIKTERWAMDEPAELTEILNQVRDQCFPLFDRNGDG